MHDIRTIGWRSRALGIAVAALAIGFLIEFGRSDQMRTKAFIEACLLSLFSYFTPALWLHWRNRDESALTWLTIPIIGTILLNLTLIQIPNEISIWNRSPAGTFVANAAEALPYQLFFFFFFFLFYSGIACLIVGLAQVIGLWSVALFRRARTD